MGSVAQTTHTRKGPKMNEYEGMPLDEIPHADYPHEPGSLYDCPRCEAECFCRPNGTSCVFCEILTETRSAS